MYQLPTQALLKSCVIFLVCVFQFFFTVSGSFDGLHQKWRAKRNHLVARFCFWHHNRFQLTLMLLALCLFQIDKEERVDYLLTSSGSYSSCRIRNSTRALVDLKEKMKTRGADKKAEPAPAAKKRSSADSPTTLPDASADKERTNKPAVASRGVAGKPVLLKKRPYRRTKRPKGYNDKSSITTTTETFQPVSAYDAVLQEAQDLMKAAAEAQQLGRLKMSASYLLLLHTRLVGLGKRFDKAVAFQERGEQAIAAAAAAVASPSNNNTKTVGSNKPTADAAAEALKSLLPHNIELDTAMMEHLARAAAELHAARTGKQHHCLTSPTAREFLANTANSTGVTNAATASGVAKAVAAIEQKEAQYWNNNNKPKAAAASKKKAAQEEEEEEEEDVVDDKFLQGRNKPATAAMRTVPYANCDAKALLAGAPFVQHGAVAANTGWNSNNSGDGVAAPDEEEEKEETTLLAPEPDSPSEPAMKVAEV